MNVDEVKALAQLVAKTKAQWELKYGTYDVNESVAATGIFSRIAGEITAVDEFEYMAKLNSAVNTSKGNLGDIYAGKSNGGKGTLLSCYARLEELVIETDNFKKAQKSLKRKYRR